MLRAALPVMLRPSLPVRMPRVMSLVFPVTLLVGLTLGLPLHSVHYTNNCNCQFRIAIASGVAGEEDRECFGYR